MLVIESKIQYALAILILFHVLYYFVDSNKKYGMDRRFILVERCKQSASATTFGSRVSLYSNIRNIGLAAWHVMWHFVINKRQKQIMDIRDGMEAISLCSFLKGQPEFSRKVFPQSCDLAVSAEQVICCIKCVPDDVKEAESFKYFLEYIKQLKTTEGNIVH
jgi:hypothetical protein